MKTERIKQRLNIETSKNEKKYKETILKLIYENIKLKKQISELIQ
jgi:hypothetical protein